jgi:hypothetical protein
MEQFLNRAVGDSRQFAEPLHDLIQQERAHAADLSHAP